MSFLNLSVKQHNIYFQSRYRGYTEPVIASQSICGPCPKMCVYSYNICNQEVFQISFRQFVREAECE
jgi:hypothetical protein